MTSYIIRAYNYSTKEFTKVPTSLPPPHNETDVLAVFDDLLDAVDWIRENEYKITGRLMLEVDTYQK